MELYEELGWKYVTTVPPLFHLWRCDDPQSPELDTDPVTQGEGYRKLARRTVRSAVNIILLAAAAVLIFTWNYVNTPLWSQMYGQLPGRIPLGIIVILSVLVQECYELRLVGRLRRYLSAGVPLVRPKSYRWQKRWGQLMTGIFVLFILGSFLDIRYDEPWSAYEGERPKEGAVFADLAVLEPEAEETFFFGPETKVHELAPRMWFIRQYTELEDGTEVVMYSEYYHLLTKRLLPRMEREMREEYARFSDPAGLEQIESEELDGFWWAETKEDGRWEQFVVASRGQNILGLQYRGKTDLRKQGEYLAALLE